LNDAPPASDSNGRARRRVIFTLLMLFLLGTAASLGPGITWDEPDYVLGGYNYAQWLTHLSPDSFSREIIDRYWAFNHEHPPAAKLVYGLAGSFQGDAGLGLFLTARIAAVAMFVALAGLVYVFLAGRFGRAAGAIGALSLALMPRVFGHGHLAALDVPVALACFATTLVFFRAHESKWRAAAAGVLWGVALLTKLNAVFLPVVLIPWALWFHGKRALVPCVMLFVLGAAVFFAGWPWLWHDTAGRVQEYAVNKAERLGEDARPTGTTSVPVHYLGTTYRAERAPWHYPFVMTLVTVPLGLLLFAGIGAGGAVRRGGTRGAGVLMLASALLPLVVLALPMVPKYDGVRLFMPAFPFVACFAGIGGAKIWAWRGRLGRTLVVAVLAFCAVVLSWTRPYELSYYSGLVGGAWGAERLGFETTYWGDTVTPDVLDAVNTDCPDGSSIAVRPPFARLRPWLKQELVWFDGRMSDATHPDFLLVFPRQGYLDEFTKNLIRTREPVRRWTYCGVPQCMLFDLRNGK